MASLKTVAAGGLLAALACRTALAADLLPPPPPLPAPPAVVEFGGWYLRGDIGVSNQRVDKLHNPVLERALPADVEFLHSRFDAAPTVGVGVGYQLNGFLRTDATVEYRLPAKYSGFERYAPLGTGDFFHRDAGTNDFTARKSEVVGLLNAYVDLGTWYGVTPFVGAGIGLAQVRISDFRDVNVPQNGLAYAEDRSRTNLAWALYAGLGYQISPSLTIEAAYRYLHLGDGRTGDTVTYLGENRYQDSWHFKEIDSHDFKVGLRWSLAAPAPVLLEEPLIRKF